MITLLRPAIARCTASRASAIQTRGLLSSVLYGSEQAKKEGELEIQQYSRLIGRGKYVHGFETHRVHPDKVDEYKKAAQEHYEALLAEPDLNVKLTGSWETTVGPLDTFVHILEYENYGGYDRTTKAIKNLAKIQATEKALRPYLQTRNHQLCQELAFLPSSPPHTQGGIFELRTYSLQPGALLEWESAWRRGIEARQELVKPVGAWFSQVGRLHQVHHMWQYTDLETRKLTREKAWQVDGWSDSVRKTAQLARNMDAYILSALPFSPLK